MIFFLDYLIYLIEYLFKLFQVFSNFIIIRFVTIQIFFFFLFK